jgi:hypothetical protein
MAVKVRGKKGDFFAVDFNFRFKAASDFLFVFLV